MLSDIVGAKGKVLMYDLPYTEQRSGAASRAFVAAHPNSKYELVDYNTLKLPENVDIVFNVLYYHDLPLNNIDTASLNKRIFDALKPGGVFFIVDHNAAPGSGTRDTKALHRIDPEVIKKEVSAAGFELVGTRASCSRTRRTTTRRWCSRRACAVSRTRRSSSSASRRSSFASRGPERRLLRSGPTLPMERAS